jgi:hypothetical protein
VVLASTLTELVVKLTPKLIEPSVVVDGCTGPDGAGMVKVSSLVALVSIRAVSHTMSRGHKLCVLDDHLATMLITMPFRTYTRVFSEEEDVHGYIIEEDINMSRKDELKCWDGYRRVRGKVAGSKGSCKRVGEGSDKGGLRGWFQGGGWDRYDSKGNKIGKCGERKPGEAKPKCFSREKAAKLGKKGRAKAVAKKRREDPNPERSGKPIHTPSTKKGLKMKEENLQEKKDACYSKVKARYKVWPSAYASGALVKCRKAGAKNWGSKSKKESKAYEGAKRVLEKRKGVMPKMKMGVHKSRAGGLTAKGVAAYRRANPGSKLKTAVTTKPSKLKKGSKAANRRKSFCSRMSGMKKRLTSKKTANDPNSRINKALRKWNC